MQQQNDSDKLINEKFEAQNARIESLQKKLDENESEMNTFMKIAGCVLVGFGIYIYLGRDMVIEVIWWSNI